MGKGKAVQNFGAGDILEVDAGFGRKGFYLMFTRETVPVVDIAGRRLVAERPTEVSEKD